MRYLKNMLLLAILLSLIMTTTAQQTPDASDFPLLPPGQHITIEYGEVAADASDTLEDAFFEVISTGVGVDTYVLSIYWRALQPSSDEITLAPLTDSVGILEAFQLAPYLVIPTIDTVNLVAPEQLMDLEDRTQLYEELNFNSLPVRLTFDSLLREIVPVFVEHGGFYLSLGNEVDVWLLAHPDEVDAFLEFVAESREFVHSIAPDLTVGVTMTFDGAVQNPDLLEALKNVSDVVAFTYYPLNPDFTVRDPSVVVDDMAQLVELAGDMPVILQEVGYPSGYLPEAGNGSSGEMQARFVENMFAAIAAHPEIRFVSFLQLGDWSDQTCDFYSDYYGVEATAFREYLCTLGLRTYSGETKPAYQALLDGLETLQQANGE